MYTRQDILDYVTTTPGNTNRQVLKGMLDDIEGSGEGGQAEGLNKFKVTIYNDSETPLDVMSHGYDARENEWGHTVYIVLNDRPKEMSYYGAKDASYLAYFDQSELEIKYYNTDDPDMIPELTTSSSATPFRYKITVPYAVTSITIGKK